MKPAAFQRSATEAARKAIENVIVGVFALLVALLTWGLGIGIVGQSGMPVTGSLFLGTLVGLAPWGIGYLAYKGIERARRRAFGPANARPPITAKNALMTLVAAIWGPGMLYLFVPRAASKPDATEVFLCLVGLFFCWVPIAEVRKCLRLNP